MLAGQAATVRKFLEEEDRPPIPFPNRTPRTLSAHDVASCIGNIKDHYNDGQQVTYRFALLSRDGTVLHPLMFRPLWLAFRQQDGTQWTVADVDNITVLPYELSLRFRVTDCKPLWSAMMSPTMLVLSIDHVTVRFHGRRRLAYGACVPR